MTVAAKPCQGVASPRGTARFLVALAPFFRGFATRFGPRTRLSGEPMQAIFEAVMLRYCLRLYIC